MVQEKVTPKQLKKYNVERYMYDTMDEVIRFDGLDPRTGLPTHFFFNVPCPGRSKILDFSPRMDCWTYSEDAGLTWCKVEFKDCVEKCDMIMDRRWPTIYICHKCSRYMGTRTYLCVDCLEAVKKELEV